MIGRGVLVRGGLTFGKISVRNGSIFGPAFIEAYDLESKVAVYPRIVVSPQALGALLAGKLALHAGNSIAHDVKGIRNLIRQGDDGVWFIDYARAFSTETDHEEQYPQWLRDHAKLIDALVQKSRKSSALSGLSLKANWMAKYHNLVVRELSAKALTELGFERDMLLINEEKLPGLVTLPTS